MDEIREVGEIKQRYEQFKSSPFAYPDFYRAWKDICILLLRIKQLEDKLTVLQDHANGLGEIIHNQTIKRIELEGELMVANEWVKKLERVAEGDERIKQLEKEKNEIPV